MLRVACGHLTNDVVDGMRLPARVDARAAAGVAPRDEDLVAGAPLVGRAAERAAGDLVEERVVVDVAAEIGAQPGLEVAEQGHGFGPDLESEAVLDPRRVAAVRRDLPGPPGCHGPLDLADPTPPSPREPGVLGLAGRHTRELTRRRPHDLARRERPVEERQGRERARDAEALLGLSSIEPDEPLGVLAQAGKAGACVRAEALGGEQPAAELALVRGAVRAQRDEPFVHGLPVGRRLGPVVGARLADEHERRARNAVRDGVSG